MAIKISGTTVIDDSKNIVNANDIFVGTGITMTASSGSISIAGTLTAASVDFPITPTSFSPSDGATGVSLVSNIVITYNQFIEKPSTGIGTTANITLRDSSAVGTIIETIGVSSSSVAIDGSVVTITPSPFPETTDIYVVIDEKAFVNSTGGDSPLLDTYNFTTGSPALGDPYEGGYLICQSGGTRWVVAPISAEVSRNWFSRANANTVAQAVSGCTGWFVPSCAQLQNPGATCKTYWDAYSTTYYWSNSPAPASRYWHILLPSGGAVCGPGPPNLPGTLIWCVRSFRTVSY